MVTRICRRRYSESHSCRRVNHRVPLPRSRLHKCGSGSGGRACRPGASRVLTFDKEFVKLHGIRILTAEDFLYHWRGAVLGTGREAPRNGGVRSSTPSFFMPSFFIL